MARTEKLAQKAGLRSPIELTGFPGTKDVRQHPQARYQGPLYRWCWKIWHHRLTRSGRWMMGFSIVALLFFGLYFSLYIQTFIVTIYAALLWLPCVPALFRAPRAQLKVSHVDRTVAGSTIPVTLTLTGTGRTERDLHIAAWGLPVAIDALDEEGAPAGTLEANRHVSVTTKLLCKKRGVYTLPGWRLMSDAPFGLVNAYRVLRETSKLIIHPAYQPLATLNLPTGRRWQPGGILTATQSGDSFEYAGNRPWREGDSLRDIDWRSTARHSGAENGGLIVREWREEFFLRVGVILDTHVPKPNDKARLETLERAVAVCAALSDALAARDYVVDIFAAGPKLVHLTAGRGLAYREQILDELALVEPVATEPLSQIAPRLTEDLGKLTTVICVFIDWDTPRQQFVDELRAQGVGVRIALLTESDDATVTASDPELRVITPSAVGSGNVAL
ncbi:MAG: DUF58 domain-containing protein [Armatimonas sp.]